MYPNCVREKKRAPPTMESLRAFVLGGMGRSCQFLVFLMNRRMNKPPTASNGNKRETRTSGGTFREKDHTVPGC